jgi:hypothetical protein
MRLAFETKVRFGASGEFADRAKGDFNYNITGP